MIQCFNAFCSYRTNYFIMIVFILGLGFLRRPLAIVAAMLTALTIAFLNDRLYGRLDFHKLVDDEEERIPAMVQMGEILSGVAVFVFCLFHRLFDFFLCRMYTKLYLRCFAASLSTVTFVPTPELIVT